MARVRIVRAAPLAVALILAQPSSPAADQPLTRSYDVSGSTYSELLASMRRNGPLVGRTGRRHPGITEVGFRPRWTVRPEATRCVLVSGEVAIDLVMTVPRWPGRADAPPPLRRRWDALRDDIVAHERVHARIARDFLGRMRRALNRPTSASDCDALNALLTKRAQTIVDRHRVAQRSFDARTFGGS